MRSAPAAAAVLLVLVPSSVAPPGSPPITTGIAVDDCLVGGYFTEKNQPQRTHPCPAGKMQSYEKIGSARVASCLSDGIYLCDGSGQDPSNPSTCISLGMLGCTQSYRVYDVAAGGRGDYVYVACEDQVRRCKWDRRKAGSLIHPASDCVQLKGVDCPSGSYYSTATVAKGGTLIVGCTPHPMAGLHPAGGTLMCNLSDSSNWVTNQVSCVPADVDPCDTAAGGANVGFRFDNDGVFLATCQDQVDDFMACRFVAPIQQLTKCSAAQLQQVSPCPIETTGVTQMPTGRTVVSCGDDGMYYCKARSEPSAAPTVSPSLVPTLSPTASPSYRPSRGPSAAPTVSPSSAPSLGPSTAPTVTPSVSPSPGPSTAPTSGPSPAPSAVPSPSPSGLPSPAPSTAPSSAPAPAPSASPTAGPSAGPSTPPSASPVPPPGAPSVSPAKPTGSPTTAPALPTTAPTAPPVNPSFAPSVAPVNPTSAPARPTTAPTAAPSNVPTAAPISPSAGPTQATVGPSAAPTRGPSSAPSGAPTFSPRTPTAAPANPTRGPTAAPSLAPTAQPARPTAAPTAAPLGPTRAPTATPVSPTPAPRDPTGGPSTAPTWAPSPSPAGPPTAAPRAPSATPSSAPAPAPSVAPAQPTRGPSASPARTPSRHPLGSAPSAAPTASSPGPTLQPSGAPSNLTSAPTTRELPKPVLSAVEDDVSPEVITTLRTGALVPGPGGRTNLALSMGCLVDDLDLDEGVPIDREFHPIGIGVGSSPMRYFAGAVIFNPGIVMSLLLLLFSVAAAQLLLGCTSAATPDSRLDMLEATGNLRTPGLAFIPFFYLLQGTTLAAANLAFYPSHGPVWSAPVGVAVLSAAAAFPVALYFRMLKSAQMRTSAVQVDDPRLSEAAHELQQAAGVRTGALLTGTKRRLYCFFFGGRIWVNTAAASPRFFVERFGVLFEGYRENLQAFLCAEMAVAVLLSLLAAWKPGGAGAQCNVRNALVFAILLALAVATLYLRPYSAPVDNILNGFNTVIVAVATGLFAAALAGGPSALYEPAGLLLLVSAAVLTVKAVYDLILYILDMSLGRRASALAAARKMPPRQSALLLDSTADECDISEMGNWSIALDGTAERDTHAQTAPAAPSLAPFPRAPSDASVSAAGSPHSSGVVITAFVEPPRTRSHGGGSFSQGNGRERRFSANQPSVAAVKSPRGAATAADRPQAKPGGPRRVPGLAAQLVAPPAVRQGRPERSGSRRPQPLSPLLAHHTSV
eukprot:TRINITY_DN16235_c0_g2_i1.p1 TRINITY_DN16235_c0_g2~~TRINITY_DN16235_c0_g2_i1.p1  ORF type:complete len:1249 (+),score=149.85 TRINITY_DN16235_c0_g2_i1:93-3839(+)